MSRGHGAVQREIIERLEARPDGAISLDSLVAARWGPTGRIDDVTYPDDPTPARYEAVRRAVARLEAEGVVQTCTVPEDWVYWGGTGRRIKFVRLTAHTGPLDLTPPSMAYRVFLGAADRRNDTSPTRPPSSRST